MDLEQWIRQRLVKAITGRVLVRFTHKCDYYWWWHSAPMVCCMKKFFVSYYEMEQTIWFEWVAWDFYASSEISRIIPYPPLQWMWPSYLSQFQRQRHNTFSPPEQHIHLTVNRAYMSFGTTSRKMSTTWLMSETGSALIDMMAGSCHHFFIFAHETFA